MFMAFNLQMLLFLFSVGWGPEVKVITLEYFSTTGEVKPITFRILFIVFFFVKRHLLSLVTIRSIV